jgi:hypothetical protein
MPPVREAALPALLLSRYLFFLSHRPISGSNGHYLQQRIHSLRSLAPALDEIGSPAVASGGALLRGMNPGNVQETADRLQLTLLPLARASVPPAYIVADTPPAADFVGSANRTLLVLGPAIGIGDEIMCFRLPAWIKAANPTAEITVLTAYDGLWDRVSDVDRIACYRDHSSLLAALRGRHELGGFDLVVLVDFENPELYQAIAAEPHLAKYAELSIGARALAAVDNRRGWVYRPPPGNSHYDTNYYDALNRMASALGLRTGGDRTGGDRTGGDGFDAVLSRRAKPDDGELVVYVSPFTSKYDPSLRYWSRLLSTLVPQPSRPVRFVLDPGTNLSTSRFAGQLARSAAASRDSGDVRFTEAEPDGRRGLTLRGVFTQLDGAHVALCADSFTAHAAPMMGCTTLVLAVAGLENWRVPFARSFYFDGNAAFDTTVSGLGQILAHHGVVRSPQRHRPPLGAVEEELVSLGHALSRTLRGDADPAEVCAAYARFAEGRDAVLRRVAEWPAGVRALLGDHTYEFPRPELAADLPAPLWRSVLRHIEDQWLRWRNTNLCKYLELVPGRDVPSRDVPSRDASSRDASSRDAR